MITFPNAKINLGLNIISKRQDGYHEISTCFYPVGWKDALEIVEAEETEISFSGRPIPGKGDNLILKAYNLLTADYDLPPVLLHLHKVIPIGAGLGGGSADAAFTLVQLNEMFGLSLTTEQLKEYAVQLGADCAFFIQNKPELAAGIGDCLSSASVNLQGKHLLLVFPGIHITTAEAYREVTPHVPAMELGDIFRQFSLEQWKDILINDFEASLFRIYPELDKIKHQLYDHGAVYASMSGSGSCMYGIFDQAVDIKFSADYEVWQGTL